LGAIPQIETIKNSLIIKTPFMTYKLILCSSSYYLDRIDDICENIEKFESTNKLKIYLSSDMIGCEIYLDIVTNDKTIEIINNHDVDNSITLPIIMLDKLKDALHKYAAYLRSLNQHSS
jgi:hypothetical protein